MRQSELSSRLSHFVDGRFREARQVLSVGSPLLLAGRDVTQLDEPAQALSSDRRFEAAFWRLSSDTTMVRAGLGSLRSALLPGAVIVIAAPLRAPAFTQLRSALSGESSPRARLESLCNALLLCGFLGPRVHDALPGWLVVSAELARTADALDAFFAQPPQAQSR